jgi:hypothetical protein
MKPGDLVRIHLPKRVRDAVGYYWHGHVGLVVGVAGGFGLCFDVLLDGVVRRFAHAYLEVINEAG